MRKTVLRGIASAWSLAMIVLLSACGSTPVGPGYYRVERGDTLSRIAARNHTTVGALVRWNNLSNADNIDVGQVLRVAPTGGAGSATRTTGGYGASTSASALYGGATSGDDNGTNGSGGAAGNASGSNTARAGTSRPNSSTASNGASATYAPKAPPSSARISLIWPASGSIVGNFGTSGNKGIDIAGSDGAPVVAAANGTVVYAGDRLRGYGMLLIVKHNADFLTAYAHNRALLVREGDVVKQGQKIAEMGNTDADRMEVHFELRYQGTSIDPTRYLPPR
jgi:lipoprotein YgeR